MGGKTRKELTDDQVSIRKANVISQIKLDLEKNIGAYVDVDDIKYVVGYKRDREGVREKFDDFINRKLGCIVADVGSGRVAVIKK
jgi:hypothetical protein